MSYFIAFQSISISYIYIYTHTYIYLHQQKPIKITCSKKTRCFGDKPDVSIFHQFQDFPGCLRNHFPAHWWCPIRPQWSSASIQRVNMGELFKQIEVLEHVSWLINIYHISPTSANQISQPNEVRICRLKISVHDSMQYRCLRSHTPCKTWWSADEVFRWLAAGGQTIESHNIFLVCCMQINHKVLEQVYLWLQYKEATSHSFRTGRQLSITA